LDETAIDDWVRALAATVPLRTPAQLRQLQFHCGKPPPAAEPSTMIFTVRCLPGASGQTRNAWPKMSACSMS